MLTLACFTFCGELVSVQIWRWGGEFEYLLALRQRPADYHVKIFA